MKHIITILLVLATLSWITPGTAQEAGEAIAITGRIEHFSQEGGFYGIKTDDGNIYRPERLSQGYLREGIQVEAQVRITKDKLLFPAWSIPVKILKIKRTSRR